MSDVSRISPYSLIAFLFPPFVETVPACNALILLEILAALLDRLFVGSAPSQNRDVPGSPADRPSLDTRSAGRTGYGFVEASDL
jgi:hypothetical protein